MGYDLGDNHINGVENFWSLVKRCIKGTYVHIDNGLVFRYLEEQTFRYNNRHHNDAQRFVKTLAAITGRRITYKDLIGESQE